MLEGPGPSLWRVAATFDNDFCQNAIASAYKGLPGNNQSQHMAYRRPGMRLALPWLPISSLLQCHARAHVAAGAMGLLHSGLASDVRLGAITVRVESALMVLKGHRVWERVQRDLGPGTTVDKLQAPLPLQIISSRGKGIEQRSRSRTGRS